MKISLPYDHGAFSLELPGGDGIAVEGTRFPPPLEDIKDTLYHTLDNPVASPGLSELLPPRGRIAVLISDITRGGSSGEILLWLLRYLTGRGIDPRRIGIFLSLGMHRGHNPQELERHLGKDIVSSYLVREHDAGNEKDLVELGTTPGGTPCLLNRRVVESKLVIGIGTVSFHYFAGFGGGRKLILPGVAAEKTILANHRLSLQADPEDGLAAGCRPGNLEGNPVHEDMVAGARLLPAPVFMVNSFFDDRGRAVFINSGDMEQSHLEAANRFKRYFSIPLRKRYRVVIASAGGCPKDINLLQSHKAIRSASYAVEAGGRLFLCAACPEGIGSDSYREAFSRGKKKVLERIRKKYTLNSQTAVSTLELTGRMGIHLKSMLDERDVALFGFIPWKEASAGHVRGEVEDEDILVIHNASVFLPVLSSP
ncbi:MAG: nickel-dependent lactate racemase [Candidatus Krumholzibacteriota bacterium]|nr:nickel-dependent lactate racemase [Candidatus Krumholzibacteriota bacterium]